MSGWVKKCRTVHRRHTGLGRRSRDNLGTALYQVAGWFLVSIILHSSSKMILPNIAPFSMGPFERQMRLPVFSSVLC